MGPPKQKGSPYNKKASKQNGGLGAPIKINSFQENSKGRVLGLYVKLPGLENVAKAITT